MNNKIKDTYLVLSTSRLGVANKVRQGPIGLVGTPGTGLQEVATLIHRLGSGISHGIAADGRALLEGISRLEEDESTEAIVIVAAPLAPGVARAVLEQARECMKPLVIHFLGSNVQGIDEHMAFVRTMHETATAAVELVGVEADDLDSYGSLPPAPSQRAIEQDRFVRGVFSGSALAHEAVTMLRRRLGRVATNLAVPGAQHLADPRQSVGHTVIDLGHEQRIAGGLHPIVEPLARSDRLLQEAADPRTGVLLFDLVLGTGVPANPAATFADLARSAHAIAHNAGRSLTIVASVCGTDEDPQSRAAQVATLKAAGILVAPSNAAAADWAARGV